MSVVEWVLLALIAAGLAFMAWAALYSVSGAWREWRGLRAARRETRAQLVDVEAGGTAEPTP